MKVKILGLILIIFTVLALAACGADNPGRPSVPGKDPGDIGTGGGDLSDPCVEHEFEFVVVLEATCTTPAKLLGTCKICNTVKSVDGSIEPDAHIGGDWIVTREATCTTREERICYCTLCDQLLATEQGEFDKNNHSLSEFDQIKPTCTTTGTIFKKCDWCSTEIKEEVPINVDAHVFKGEYCPRGDVHVSVCANCGVTGEALEHVFDRLEHDAESHYSICQYCAGRYNVIAHDWEKVTIDPTYQNAGYFYYRCTSCTARTDKTDIDPLPQVTPEYTIPQGIVCVYGSRLGDISLPEGFFFESPGLAAGDVGENIHIATYVHPNDNEGKYLTVYGIPITVTVIPATIEIKCDFSDISSRAYNAERVPDPKISIDQQHIMMQIIWYCGDTPLDIAPCDAGEYRVVVTVTDKNYTAEPLVHNFTIERAEAEVNTDFVTDRGYTGEKISFRAPDGAVLTYSDKDGNPINAPIERGEYLVTVYIPGSKNYLPFEITLPFSIVTDTEAPTWAQEHVYLPIDTRTYTLDAIDNGKIAYYHVCAYTRSVYEMNFITTNPVIEVSAGEMFYVEAIDAAGNVSQCMYISVQPDIYRPTQITPANGATINTSYVRLQAENATYYYFSTDPNGEFEQVECGFILSLKAGQTYYWYASCAYSASEIYSFTVEYDGVVPPTLIYPENNAVITDSIINLIGTSSNGATVFYASEHSPELFSEYYANGVGFRYGIKYLWYVEDADGNRSETREFLYIGNYGTKESDLEVIISSENHAYHHVVIGARGPLNEGYISYVIRGANGELKHGSGSFQLFYKAEDGTLITNLRDLENGDTVYVKVVDSVYQSHSKVKTFTIDLEAPVVGEVRLQEDGSVMIGVGSDNSGAMYEYRFVDGDWTSYNTTVILTKEELEGKYPYIELRARDKAGNRGTGATYFGIDSESAPEISIEDRLIGGITNKNVVICIDGNDELDDFYFINGERFEINKSAELLLSKEGDYVIWTSVIIDEVEQFSAPIKFTIDKTAPEFGELYYKAERTNINGEYNFICLDPNYIVEDSEFEITYAMREVNDEFKPYETNGRVPLYSYYIADSGYYYVDIKITDSAGNSTMKTATMFFDVEGPTISAGRIKYEYDEETGESKCYIVFEDIHDDFGYYYHMHFQIWDQNAYDNGLESIVSESFYTEEGESSYIYDASHLQDGTTYYFLAYVVDDLINASYSLLYYFEKQPPSPSTN